MALDPPRPRGTTMQDAARRPEPLEDRVGRAVGEARVWLADHQSPDGHWVFELEADATIPAEFILLGNWLGERDPAIEARLAAKLRRLQGADGGWPLFLGGEAEISATVKAYYALKLAGDDPGATHMAAARARVLGLGGAARVNVFTRFTLALFGQMSWNCVPVTRVEAALLPGLSPFHLAKVAYWTRTVMVPLMILATLKPVRTPRGIGVAELWADPEDARQAPLRNPTGRWPGEALLRVDRLMRRLERFVPKSVERRGIEACLGFMRERLNGEHGLGAIFPAMANALMAMEALGVPPDNPERQAARRALDLLLTENGCQPCLSPVWDTALAGLAIAEAGVTHSARAAASWLAERQILDVAGDWAWKRPNTRPGGWAFQYRNDHYPDVDDTAAAAMALDRADRERHREAIVRAAEWIVGMQSRGGGWGAFDADNTHAFLDNIPFADHGALRDPPTADVSARCLAFLAQTGLGHEAAARAVGFLWRAQEPEGSWFGRWGTNYIYGTWSALVALSAAGVAPWHPRL
ncbi:MAG: squalene--hopene cyclase, partial [Alphaproteobacteria bacterium]|nr:squalene--hopene cyclase [Alphaproteobacteria bacterium]